MENPLVDESGANETLTKLGHFLNTVEENVDLAYFFGIAFDEDRDRERFGNAVDYLLENNFRTPKLILCIDPNLTRENIKSLFSSLQSLLRAVDQFIILGIEAIPLPEVALQQELEGGARAKKINDSPKARPPMSARSVTKHPSEGQPYFYKVTFKKSEGPTTTTFYFYFLRYALTSAYSREIGEKKNNQFYIQQTVPVGIKTLENYTERCRYDILSFYSYLEELALHRNVQNLYIASALSSHDTGGHQIIHGEDTYNAVNMNPDRSIRLKTTLSNRYFEDFCEVLTLLEKVKSRKPVFFITLDGQFRVFNHPYVERRSEVPYTVPFNRDVAFYVNRPPFYRRVRTGDFGLPVAVLDGGKRKRTRSLRKKRRVTRKH